MKRGDYVKLISGGGFWPLTGFNNNEIYKISNPKETNHEEAANTPERFIVRIVNKRGTPGFAKLSQLKSAENKDFKRKLLNRLLK